MKYFLYARKSTDVEDKQVLSIEAQLAELRALAKREQLNVVEVFVEKKSAKSPDRPVFGEWRTSTFVNSPRIRREVCDRKRDRGFIPASRRSDI